MSVGRDRFGVVVVGAGDMGARHARWWAATGAEVVAVADPDPVRAQALAEAHGALALPDPGDAFARDDVDAVSVCTPTYLHRGFVVAALNAGKHVLCEKPVALTGADAEAMRAAAERSSGVLRIGFMRRFDPADATLAGYVRELGRPILAQATITAGVRPKRLMHDANANGGPLIDMCCHVFDQWERYFGGPPELVRASGHTFARGKPGVAGIEELAVDSAQVTLRYPGGDEGHVLVSWGLPSGVPATEQHTYLGPDGRVASAWPDDVQLQRGGEALRWLPPPADPWREEIAAFRRELAGLEPRRLADIDEGIRALRTSLAALVSIAEGREVGLSEFGPPPGGAEPEAS